MKKKIYFIIGIANAIFGLWARKNSDLDSRIGPMILRGVEGLFLWPIEIIWYLWYTIMYISGHGNEIHNVTVKYDTKGCEYLFGKKD